MTHTTAAQSLAVPRRAPARVLALGFGLAAAFLFVAHGVAHAVGFAGTWGLTESDALSDGFTLLAELDPDGVALHALGLLWLAPIPLYLVAAAGLVLRKAWWWTWAFAATLVSLALCILWLEPARVGLVVNVVIIAGLAAVALLRRRARR